MATQTITASGVALTGLITPTEYNNRANLSSPSNSTQIQQSILDATSYIMERTGRWFVDANEALTDVKLFSGNGEKDFFPPQGPIISLISIELWDGDSWETIDSDIYDQQHDGNKIWFRSGGVWVWGKENWRITYTYGFKGGIPRDLKKACYQLSRNYVHDMTGNLQSQSDGEQSFTYFGDKKLVDRVITRYQRYGTRG